MIEGDPPVMGSVIEAEILLVSVGAVDSEVLALEAVSDDERVGCGEMVGGVDMDSVASMD